MFLDKQAFCIPADMVNLRNMKKSTDQMYQDTCRTKTLENYLFL